MYKSDCEINKWVVSGMRGLYDWITDATVDCEEDYLPYDIAFSASTTSGHIIPKKMEVKSIKGGFQFKYDGQWNNWFSTMNPDGIIRKMAFGNVPPPDMDILDVPLHWKPETLAPEYGEMPKEWENKHIYFLNAEDMYHRVHNSKTYKMYEGNICLCYAAQDGFIFYSHPMLRKSFLGYVWYQNKSHTEERNEKRASVWELKAVFDLEMGAYHHMVAPKGLFNKKYNN